MLGVPVELGNQSTACPLLSDGKLKQSTAVANNSVRARLTIAIITLTYYFFYLNMHKL
jgi:hypothetical protein